MLIRAKAPLRLGLAGGGTDVSPYSDTYGGAVLNATISLYASATIEPLDTGEIILDARDLGQKETLKSESELPIDGKLDLLKGVYNRIVRQFTRKPLSFRLTTFVDVPKGSGLGSSSTITVAIIGAFVEWLQLPLGEYEIARLAFEVERIDLGMAGGKQDQYAATFGGFNFMEFGPDKVIVNPLRIKEEYKNELEFSLLLYHLGTTRLSSEIIKEQSANFVSKQKASLEAAHHLKEQAVMMKESLLTGRIPKIGELLHFGWTHKKQTAVKVSNPHIDEVYHRALDAGATGGKISGAGGGGFMLMFAPGNTRYAVMDALAEYGGEFRFYKFVNDGLTSWSSPGI